MRSLISLDFPAPEMEPESAHVVSAVSVPRNRKRKSDEWQEVHQMLLSPGQKSAISARVSNNWTSFDAAHSVRDLRSDKDGHGEHLWEICCSPNSSLRKKMARQGFRATRLTHETNFDLSSRKKVDQAISLIPHSQPTHVWASPRCTAVSFQDMNQRTPEQRHELFFSSVTADFALRLGPNIGRSG